MNIKRLLQRLPYKLNDIRYGALQLLNPRNKLVLRRFKRTEWHDYDSILFEAMFEVVRRYVEEECAWMTLMVREEREKFSKLKQFLIHRMPYFIPKAERRVLGTKHLDWEISLGDESPEQAASALEIKTLYEWYNDEYLNRKEPFDFKTPTKPYLDEGGNPTEELFGKCFEDGDVGYSRMNHFSAEYGRLLDGASKLEAEYNNQDNEMLIRLVKIRPGLWT